jgi:type II secretion system protein N
MTPEKRRVWKRRAGWGAFALFAFVVALRQTFPAEAVGERLIIAAATVGWKLDVVEVKPAGFFGVRMTGVTLLSSDGARIPVERATAAPRLLPLLVGRRGVSFDARLAEGRVHGVFEEGRGKRRILAQIEGVDLGRIAGIRKLAGLDLAGVVRGNVDLSLDLKDATKSAGGLDLAIDRAAVQGGEVPIAAMGGGALTLPRIGLGALTAKASVKEGRATFDTLATKGEDLELDGAGLYFVVQPRLAQAPIQGRAKLRVQDAFWQKSGTATMKGIFELALASGRAPDGSYGLQIFGTLGRPQLRPAAPGAAEPPQPRAAAAAGAQAPRPAPPPARPPPARGPEDDE